MLSLTCGCCGQGFRGPLDPRHDSGFGECAACVKRAKDANEKQWRKLEAMWARALNAKNRRRFLKEMDLPLRRGLLLKAMDEGLISWKIKRTGVVVPLSNMMPRKD